MTETVRRGIYTMVNDVHLEWALAFFESVRAHEPDIPLHVIPFDHRMQRIRRLAPRYRFDIYEHAALAELDRLGAQLTTHPIWRNMYRKLSSFWGPLQQFIYLDSDIVLLESLTGIWHDFCGSGAELMHWEASPGQAYGETLALAMREQHEAREFCAGTFVSSRDVITLDEVRSSAPQATELATQLQHADQGLLNYLADRKGLRMASVLDLAETPYGGTWAVHARRRGNDWVYGNPGRSQGKRMVLIHWAGYNCNASIPHGALYLHYRAGAEGSPLRRCLFKAWWLARRFVRLSVKRLFGRWLRGWIPMAAD